MWKVTDSDGVATLHSLLPYWAENSDHLTVTEMVPKVSFDAAITELAEARKEIARLEKLSRQHMQAMAQRARRLREVEASNNTYYALLQRHNIYKAHNAHGLVDDTPIITAEV